MWEGRGMGQVFVDGGIGEMVWAEQKLDPNITALQYPLRVTGNGPPSNI